jgi:hypothetical protein
MIELLTAFIIGFAILLTFLVLLWLIILFIRSLRCLVVLFLIILGIYFLGTLIIKQMNYYDKVILQRGQE